MSGLLGNFVVGGIDVLMVAVDEVLVGDGYGCLVTCCTDRGYCGRKE